MRNLYLDAERIMREIDALVREYPELADDEVLLRDMVEGSTDAQRILENLVEDICTARSLAKAARERAEAIRNRAARYDRQEEAFGKLALRLMEAMGERKFSCGEATLSIRQNPPSVVIVDEAALPEWAIRIKREPNKSAIKDRLKAGDEVAGAALSNGGESLSVRTN